MEKLFLFSLFTIIFLAGCTATPVTVSPTISICDDSENDLSVEEINELDTASKKIIEFYGRADETNVRAYFSSYAKALPEFQDIEPLRNIDKVLFNVV